MYLNKVFFNENEQPVEVELICNKCGKITNITDMNQFDHIKSDYCITSQNNTITCSNCGEKCNIGLIEYKKNVAIKQVRINHQSQQSNQPKCPTCGSTNIRKIGTGERAASIIGFGIFSKKINKTWKCNNCGHTW